MKLLLAFGIAALPALSLVGAAQAAEDRYGPPPAHATSPAMDPGAVAGRTTVAYSGPFLSWAGKTAAPTPVAPPPPMADPASPADPVAESSPPPANIAGPQHRRQIAVMGPAGQPPEPAAPPMPPPAEPAPSPAPMSWPAPAPHAPQPVAAAILPPSAPASVAQERRVETRAAMVRRHAAPDPAPAPTEQAAVAPRHAMPADHAPAATQRAVVAAPASPAPQQATVAARHVTRPAHAPAAQQAAVAPASPVAARAPQAAASPQPPAAESQPMALAASQPAPPAPSPPVGVRYYSVMRDYGMSPDPVPTPTDRPMVLIGPPADAPPSHGDGADDSDHAPSDHSAQDVH